MKQANPLRLRKRASQPKGKPQPVPDPIAPPEPGQSTAFAPGAARTREAASLGGKAVAEKNAKLRLIKTFGEKLGFRPNSEILRDEDIKPHLESACTWLEMEIVRLAKEVGAGYTPPNAVATLIFAARSLAFSNYYADRMNAQSSEMSAKNVVTFLKEAEAMTARSAVARAKAAGRKGTDLIDYDKKSKVTLFVEGKGVVGHEEVEYTESEADAEGSGESYLDEDTNEGEDE